MGLLQCPGELLDQIIDLTLPDGLESFVLSCRLIYGRAAAQIARHNRLTRLSRYAARPTNDKGKALLLLFELSRDSLLAEYIRVLNLRKPISGPSRPDSPPFVDDMEDDSAELVKAVRARADWLDVRNPSSDDTLSDTSQLTDEFQMEDESMERIKTMVTQADWLEQAGVDVEAWWESMMKEDRAADEQSDGREPPYNTVSLLSRLSALQTLQLPNAWHQLTDMQAADEDPLLYVLNALIEYSNAHTHSESTPLRRLSTILPFMAVGYEQRAALQSVGPFFTLSAIREFFGTSMIAVEDHYTGIPFSWDWQTDSPLRRLELAHCCMDGEGIARLLAHTPLLQVFRYSHETKWHDCLYDWNPGDFVQAIARHCGSTILELALTIDEMPGEIVCGPSTLLAFPRLETIEADVRIFCGPPVESGQRKGIDAYVPPGDTPWTPHDIPCIGSMVPVGAVNVYLNTDFPDVNSTAPLRALLKNIKQQKDERLRKLKEVIIRQYNGDSAKEIFAMEGLVRVFDGSERGPLKRSMLPKWKRDFAERVGGIAYT